MKYIKVIGLIILLYIISTLDYKTILLAIIEMDPFYILLFSISWYLFLILKIIRWHIIENHFCKPLKFKQNSWLYIETLYLSFITPARAGDVMRVWLMKKEFGIDKSNGFTAYFFDRIQDLFFMALFALYGVVFVLKIEVSKLFYIFIFAVILLYFMKNKIAEALNEKFKIFKYLKTDTILELKLLAVNIAAFLLYFLQFHILSKAFGLEISYHFIIALLSISAIASLIPISVSGLGVREGIFIYLFSTIHIGKEYAVLLSLLDNIFFMALFIIILYIFNNLFLKKNLFD